MKKMVKYISGLLISIFLFTFLIWTNVIIGAETDSGSTNNTENRTNYNYTQDKADLEYSQIIKKLVSFKDTGTEERLIVSDYLDVDYNLLLEAEANGYSIADSILIAQIISKGDLSLEDVKEGILNLDKVRDGRLNDEGILKLYYEVKEYANILEFNDFSDATKKQMKSYITKGYDAAKLEQPGIIADIYHVNLKDIIKNDNKNDNSDIIKQKLEKTYTREEINKLDNFANENNISIEWLYEYTNNKKIKLEQFYQDVKNYEDNGKSKVDKDKEDKDPDSATKLSENEISSQSNSSPYTICTTPEEEDLTYEAPFSYKKYNEDSVEMNTGSLIFENTDVYLPGKNGLDFILKSRYDSDEDVPCEKELFIADDTDTVKIYNVQVKFDVYEDEDFLLLDSGNVARSHNGILRYEYERLRDIYQNNGEVTYIDDYDHDGDNDWFVFYLNRTGTDYENGDYYADCSFFNPTYNQKDSPLGTGWSFVFDSIEIVADDGYFNDSLGQRCHFIKKAEGKYLHLSAGQLYKINDDLELEEYKLNDMQLALDSSYTNGQNISSYYILKFNNAQKNGLKEYFAEDGRLLAQVDRYNNVIEYQHTLIRNHPVVTKIIDTLGREVTINYDFDNLQVVVTAPDNKQITYQLTLAASLRDPETGADYYTYSYRVAKRIDTENRETTFAYNSTISLVYYFLNAPGGPARNILSKVTYPTGAYLEYEYDSADRYLTDYGSESYPIVKRRHLVETKNNLENQRDYIYQNNYTRYPFEYGDKNDFELEDLYPESYSFIIVDRNELTAVQDYEFNYENQLVNEENYTSNGFYYVDDGDGDNSDDFIYKVNKDDIFNSSEYEYDNTDYQMTQKRTKVYTVPESGDQDLENYLLEAEDFDYDEYGNLKKYWGFEAGRDANNELVSPSSDTHLVTYNYDTGYYHLLTSKQYKQEATTTISESNTLTADRKNISQKLINQNGVQKAKTTYLYDQGGNVSSEKKYLADNSWGDYIETHYSYEDNDPARNGQFDGGYVTRKWTEGITDADGNLVSARTGLDQGLIDTQYKYDNYGNVIESYDGQGEKTAYQYDNLGRIIKTINPDLTEKTLDYDDVNNILTVTDENAVQMQRIYDSLGNLIYEKDVASGEYLKTYTYNLDFLLEEEINNENCQNYYCTEYTYYDDSRVETKTTRQNGGMISQEEYRYFDAYDSNSDGSADCSVTVKTMVGDPTSPSVIIKVYTDKQGNTIKTARMHDSVEYADLATYDYVGNKIEEKSARANNEAWSETYTQKYEYDYAGNVIKEYNVNGDFSTTDYDALGRKTAVTDIKAHNAAVPYAASYHYDSLGRLVSEQVPFEDVGGTISYTAKKYYYDRNGNIETTKETNNLPGQAASYSTVENEYNNRDRLVKVITYNNEAPENYTQYYYDAAGNKLRMYSGLSSPLTITGLDDVTPGSDSEYAVSKYEYDRFGQLTKMTDPLNQEETYAYDLNGNMTAKSDRNGSAFTMSYDGVGRLLSKSVETAEGSGDATYAYTYNLSGNIKTMSGGGVDTSYSYDDLGRLINESESNGIAKEYTYDAADNRKSLTINKDGVTEENTTYTYDKLNRLYQVSENGQLQATYTYDDNGNREALAYNNGNATNYSYNLANRLRVLTNTKGQTILSQYAYTYLLNGNQAEKQETVTGKTTAYSYDGLGRLLSETESTGGAQTSALQYTYDSANNRATMVKTVEGTTTTTGYEYDLNNRLLRETGISGDNTTIANYSYDNNGNQLCKALETEKPSDPEDTETITAAISGEGGEGNETLNEYDGFNQLIKVTSGDMSAAYTYNGVGLRSGKIINGTTTGHIWDGQNIVLELDGDGEVSNKYLRGINLIFSEDSQGVQEYYLFNGHGDVVQLTGTDGNVSKTYDYDAFGNEKNPDENDPNVFRYCGEYFDKETGTIYLRARYYDPATSRMLSEDTYRGDIRDPLSLNLYVYCYNNPIMWIDPTGHYVMSIYSDPNGGQMGGHSFIVILNDSDAEITLGAYTLGDGQSVSVGTWGNKEGHNGIWYNLEAYFYGASPSGYSSYVSVSMEFDSDQLSTVNKFIGDNDTWSLYRNCSFFAAGVWNSVSDTKVTPLSWWGWNNPAALAASIKGVSGYQTGTAFASATTEQVGYLNNGVYYVPPANSSAMSTPRSSSHSSSGSSGSSSSGSSGPSSGGSGYPSSSGSSNSSSGYPRVK